MDATPENRRGLAEPEGDDLTPEDEAWCVEFFRNLFPEDDDDA